MELDLPTLYDYYTSGGINSGLSDAQPYFTLNDKNITIISGSLHYYCIPQEYWRDRMRKMRAAGFNALETYTPWNLHEQYKGVYDFGRGGSDYEEFLDLEKFLKTAQEEDLLVIVRPGPYIKGEVEFGGLPSWLLREEGIRLRTSDKTYMGYVEKYFKVLLPILANFQFTRGGPIIAFQIENEYGNTMHGNTTDGKNYLQKIKKIFLQNGLKELFLTCDTPLIGNSGSISDVLYAANFPNGANLQLSILKKYQPDRPSLVMEFWDGWYDHWNMIHMGVPVGVYSSTLEDIFKFPASVNMYMFHGGTHFGFLNGADFTNLKDDNSGYLPITSSYDFDALLTESGEYTEKYEIAEKLIEKYNPVKTYKPLRPPVRRPIAYNTISIVQEIDFLHIIKQIKQVEESKNVKSMEHLSINHNSGQNFGYVVYRKEKLKIPANSVLKIEGRVCDTVVVLINGEIKSKIFTNKRDMNKFGFWKVENATLNLGNEKYHDATLDLMVENFGRADFVLLHQQNQYKGLWQGDVLLNDQVLYDWKIIPLEFKKSWNKNLKGWRRAHFKPGPSLYRGFLKVDVKEDTFIDTRGWTKGIIIVNGFVLSRYFSVGPQLTAFLPAPFLKVGLNEIVFFEHYRPKRTVDFVDEIIYGRDDCFWCGILELFGWRSRSGRFSINDRQQYWKPKKNGHNNCN